MTLKDIRLTRGMTQKQLADAIGVSLAVMSRYESGKINPPANRVCDIANVLGVSTDTLFSGIGPINNTRAINTKFVYEALSPAIATVRKYNIAHSGGFCELCGQPAPFRDKDNNPYLEIYFLTPLENSGNCDIWNSVALCPNCKKKVQILGNVDDIEKLKAVAENHK